MKIAVQILLVLLLSQAVLGESAPPDYKQELDSWHQQRLDKLTKPNGYLSLVGLHWLSEDPQEFPGIGVAWYEESKVHILLADGHKFDGRSVDKVTLSLSKPEGEEYLTNETRRFYAIKRGPKIGLRVKDSQAGTRVGFKGIKRFEPSLEYRFVGKLEPESKELAVASVVGVSTTEESPGWAVFERGGENHRVRLIGKPGDKKFFLVFSDKTAGKSTYPACRFLSVERGEGDALILDFNKSINPACAFTEFATCPLPPEENVLPFPILAGEMSPK